jgi:hypothetical protein
VSVSLNTIFWLASVSIAQAASISGSDGLVVTVTPTGVYTISTQSPSWSFGGSIGYPVSNLAVRSGADPAGGLYNEISFDFVSDAQRHAAIRSYLSKHAVLFTTSLPDGGPNSFSFPSLTTYPASTHHIAFDGLFGNPTFQGANEESPWVSFDSEYHTVILSAASHFMVASTGTADGRLRSGISSQIASLPPGFTHQTVLVMENGINRAFDSWGNLLTGLTGKVRPTNDADLTLSHLGYWTDAGATYYYSMEPGLSYPETLSAVKADFDRQGIPLGYLQLDSWFYPKGPTANWVSTSGGIYEYLAATPPFASSLSTFQSSLGLPLVTHARWIDSASPYRQQFQMSGSVSIDPRYWAQVANYLSNAGVVAFEQDWLFGPASTDFNLTDGDAFLDNMASAMTPKMTIQYCSGTARHFLQSAQYNNLTTMRASGDRFDRTKWTNFLYASRLASAVGVWPFTDVFMSSEADNLLLATLSAGPVGVGDRIGAINADNLRRAVRGDGVIVKPDVPLAPIDSSFWSDSNGAQAPMVTATYTDFGDLRAWYLLEYPQGENTRAIFRLADAGVTRAVYLYDYLQGTGRMVQPEDPLNIDATGYQYQIAAPVGPSGIAVLGDTGHFVTLGRKRVTALSDNGVVHISLAFAKGETSRTIRGYSPKSLAATATTGRVNRLNRDSATGQFSVDVTPGPDGTASLQFFPVIANRDCAQSHGCVSRPRIDR